MTSKFVKNTKAVVKKRYQAKTSPPLQGVVGSRLIVAQRDTEWPEFIWCIDTKGIAGWVPVSYLKIQGENGILLRAYISGELTVREGDILILIEEAGGWFWAETESGKLGWVPGTCVEIT